MNANARIRLTMLAVAIAAGLASCSSSADDAVREQMRDTLVQSKQTGEPSANLDTPSGQSDEDSSREAVQTGQNAPFTALPPESEPLSLIAEIPDRDIRLYGAPDGVVLQVGEHVQAFEWDYMTPRGIMPVMHAADYDADGEEELAIDLHIGSGTGIAVDELHIVEFDETDRMEDHVFAESDYLAQLEEQLKFRVVSRDRDVLGEITVGSRTHHVNLAAFASEEYGKILDRLIYGSIVWFEASPQKLTAEIAVGVGIETFATPQYIGTVQADVTYRNGRFYLRNIAFEPYPEYIVS